MYKATLSLAVLAVAELALAAQPYCLLTAINKFDHPADMKTICGQSDKVNSYIQQLCPPNFVSDAKQAFQTACSGANYNTNSSNSTSSSASSSSTASSAIVYTSTYYDYACSCTKTSTMSTPYATGFVTGTAPLATGTAPSTAAAAGGFGSSSAATGSPIAPAAGPSSTSTPASSFGSGASQNMVSGAAALFGLAALIMAL